MYDTKSIVHPKLFILKIAYPETKMKNMEKWTREKVLLQVDMKSLRK